MKQLLFIVLFGISNFIFSQSDLPYKLGEYASYTLHFGVITVGVADLEITECIQLDNSSVFHIVGKAKTASFFDWFFKVRDVYETFIDTSTLLPVMFKRDVNEGGYLINQIYQFNHDKGRFLTKDSSFSISTNTQDMLSAFFLARTFKKDGILKGKSFYVPIFMDEENFQLEIKYLSNEVIDTKWGKIDCMVFQPKMQEGRVFEHEEQLKIWITNDSNHLLLKVEAEIWAGTVRVVLDDYKKLKHPLTIIRE